MKELKKWYTIERNSNRWVVWFNKEGEHSYGSLGIYSSESKKECMNFCKEKGIKLDKRYLQKIYKKVKIVI